MPQFLRDGLSFHYHDSGEGTPFVFQHGLGADITQPLGVFRPPAGYRLLAVDCRAHGETRPVGDEGKLNFDCFADDLMALLDHLDIPQAVFGGISMGAGISLNIALRYPQRVLGLVLSRPAWLDAPWPENLCVLASIARLIREHGARTGRDEFRDSEEYVRIHAESPDAANSMLGQFNSARAVDGVARLERLPNDAPSRDRSSWRRIDVPMLVLGNRQDPVHPWSLAETLAGELNGAELVELTPKSVSKERHATDVQRAVEQFLTRRIPQ
jgi:pimeloyl-ACP methyl ester carboxylesterase